MLKTSTTVWTLEHTDEGQLSSGATVATVGGAEVAGWTWRQDGAGTVVQVALTGEDVTFLGLDGSLSLARAHLAARAFVSERLA